MELYKKKSMYFTYSGIISLSQPRKILTNITGYQVDLLLKIIMNLRTFLKIKLTKKYFKLPIFFWNSLPNTAVWPSYLQPAYNNIYASKFITKHVKVCRSSHNQVKTKYFQKQLIILYRLHVPFGCIGLAILVNVYNHFQIFVTIEIQS